MAKSREVKLLLIRSGPTSWDETGRLSGSADHPLSEAGVASLDALATGIQKGSVVAVLHAPDEASTETAKRIGRAAGAKLRAKDGLAEVDMGLWEGLLKSDLEDRYPTVYARWVEDPTAVSVPDGEPVLEADARLRAAIAKAIEKCADSGDTVALVLRPFAWGLLRCRLLGRPLAECWEVSREGPAMESLGCVTGQLLGLTEKAPAQA